MNLTTIILAVTFVAFSNAAAIENPLAKKAECERES